VREPVAVAGPEFHVVCVFVRSSMLSVCLSGVLTLVQKFTYRIALLLFQFTPQL